MPEAFEKLAVFNGERARGLVHTAEWAAAMTVLQADFDDWQHGDALQWAQDEGLTLVFIEGGGSLAVPPSIAHRFG
jgi:hypothetical protein